MCCLNDYCEEPFKGFRTYLPYITEMRFDAIWISQIVANVPKEYHEYWPQNMYEISTNFRTEQDFINLVTARHTTRVYIIRLE